MYRVNGVRFPPRSFVPFSFFLYSTFGAACEQKMNHNEAMVDFLGSQLRHLKEVTLQRMDFLYGLRKTGKAIGEEYDKFAGNILGMNTSARQLVSYQTNGQAQMERCQQAPPPTLQGLDKGKRKEIEVAEAGTSWANTLSGYQYT